MNVQHITSFCAVQQLAAAEFAGADAATFLQGQLTVNVAAIPAGQFRRAAYCSRQGRILANGLLCRTSEERFVFIVSADLAADLISQLQKFILRAKVRANVLPVKFFAEDNAAEESAENGTKATGEGDGANADANANANPTANATPTAGATPTPTNSVTTENDITTISADNWRLHFAITDAAAAQLTNQQTHADSDSWTRAEIARAIPWICAETQGQFIPQFVNFEALNGVDFDKGCYVGQEIIARLHYLGEVKQRAMRISGSGTPPPPMTPLTTAEGKPAGAIINAAATADGFTALAAIKLSAAAAPLQLGDTPIAAIRPPPYPLPAAIAKPAK